MLLLKDVKTNNLNPDYTHTSQMNITVFSTFIITKKEFSWFYKCTSLMHSQTCSRVRHMVTYIQRHKNWISKSACSKTSLSLKNMAFSGLTKCKKWLSDHVCLFVLRAEHSSNVVKELLCKAIVWHHSFTTILTKRWSFKDVNVQWPQNAFFDTTSHCQQMMIPQWVFCQNWLN